jgi:hypothetical protein
MSHKTSCYDNNKALISVQEYREFVNDGISSDEQIKKRLVYLEAFCRKIIKYELEKYVTKTGKK